MVSNLTIVLSAIVILACLLSLVLPKPLPPEVYTVALGLAAAVTAFWVAAMTDGAKLALVLLFVVLAALQLYSSGKDRERSEKEYKDGIQAILQSIEAKSTVAPAVVLADARIAAAAKHGTDPGTLKNRALALSKEILGFLLDRQRLEPSMPRSDSWANDTEKIVRYSTDTNGLFSRNYGAKVIAVRNEFAARGIADPELDSFYEHPTNMIGMRIVGERIGALGERISEGE